MFKTNRILAVPVLFLTLAFTEYSFSSPTTSDSYKCTIKAKKILSDDGLLEPNKKVTEKVFFVDRSTGMANGGFKNYISPNDVKVINRGSKEFSFVALSSVGPHDYVNYIEIHEYVSSEIKPFLALDNWDGILTGTCVGR